MSDKVKTAIGLVMVAVIIVCFFVSCGGSSSSDDEDEVLESRRASCEARTDTYHKCSYSLWEGRCVCKTR